jgi:hypothetical protein
VSRARRPRTRPLWPLLVTLLFACDISGSGGSSGCLRVHQGDYTFPVKRVVEGAVSTRVTAAGVSLVTEHIHTLIGALFEVDDQGRAIIPLATLGLETITTTLGLFSGELQDAVLTLDLASLTVTLVEGSSPPRIKVSVVDADVGILSGSLAGSVNLLLTEPDLACALGNGPQGRVARLSFDIEITLSNDQDGSLDVAVGVASVDIQDVAIDITVDCTLDECQDGCSECMIVCTTAALGAQLTTVAQAVLDGLVDDIATWLADQLATPLLDQLVNDKPLAIEGTLNVATMARLLLPALHSVLPLGVVTRPTGEAFSVTGTGDDAALEIDLDAGVDAAVSHPCVGEPQAEPVFEATPPPPWPETLPDGGTYHAGVALSEALVDQTMYAAWRAGALCIDATTADVATLTAGQLVVRAATLELMLPGISAFAGDEASIQLSIRPAAGSPPTVRFVDGDAPIRLSLERVEVSVALFAGDGFQRVLAITSDFEVSIALDPLSGGRIGLRVSDIVVAEAETTFAGPFEAARIDLVVPFVVDLLTGTLADTTFELDVDPTGTIAALTGIPLVPSLRAISATDNWLQLLVTAEVGPPEPAPMVAVHVTRSVPGALSVHTSGPPGAQVQLRIGRGGWTPWFDVGGAREVPHPRLWLLGEVGVTARYRADASSPPGEAAEVGRVTIASAAPSALTPAVGCAAGGGRRTGAAAFLLFALLLAVRRRTWAALLACALLAGCGDSALPPSAPCEDHASCPATYLCIEGLCAPADPCAEDGDCCPGAECVSGWCRPTEVCDTSEDCLGLDTACEEGLCVPRPCASDLGCASGHRCVADRCLPGAPCDGTCAGDEACHVATGRCVTAECACEAGTVAIVAAGVDVLSCESPVCACAAAAPAPGPSPGQEGRLLNLGGALMMVSYDPVYGDLVWSIFGEDGAREDHPVAGVPEAAPTSSEEDYRGGVSEPGPDVGRHPAAVVVASEAGLRVATWFQHVDEGLLHYARLTPWDGAIERTYPLSLEGISGRFSCLTTDGETGALVGWVYVESDAAGERSRLLRLNASSAAPDGLSDWEVTVLSEALRPLQAPAPCDDTCELIELCLRGAQGDRCVSALAEPTCEGGCPAHHVCALEGDDATTCLPRVYREAEGVGALPSGAGLFLTCSSTPEGAIAAWYDADAGAIAGVRGPGGQGEPFWIDGTPAPLDGSDRGRHASVTATEDGEVTVLYQDVTGGRVLAAQQGSLGEPWEITAVHDGLVSGGLHALGTGLSASRMANGREAVAYGDGTTGELWLAARAEEGCWHRALALSPGTWLWPTLVATGEDTIGFASVRLSLDDTLSAHRELRSVGLVAPNGDCSAP